MYLPTITSIVLLAFGCNDSGGDSDPSNNSTLVDDTGSPACRDVITWDSYANGFFLDWCTSCHNSSLETPEERQGAPLDMNFDRYPSVVEHAVAIEYRAVTVPAQPKPDPKVVMPPESTPPQKERELLGLWIQCGLKEQ